MPLEDLEGPDKFPDALVRENPLGADVKSEGDDHLRGIKNVIKNTFPALEGAVTLDEDEINALPADIVAAVQALRVAFIGIVAPTPLGPPNADWLPCDGSLLLVATFPALGAYLGAAYGGDGVTDFAVPDYQGEFLRGTDAGTGRDPDAGTRTDRGDGTTGDAPGTRQLHAVETHVHSYNEAGPGATQLQTAATREPFASLTGPPEGGALVSAFETRARNVGAIFCIFAGPPA